MSTIDNTGEMAGDNSDAGGIGATTHRGGDSGRRCHDLQFRTAASKGPGTANTPPLEGRTPRDLKPAPHP